jgi:hypothetical protein
LSMRAFRKIANLKIGEVCLETKPAIFAFWFLGKLSAIYLKILEVPDPRVQMISRFKDWTRARPTTSSDQMDAERANAWRRTKGDPPWQPKVCGSAFVQIADFQSGQIPDAASASRPSNTFGERIHRGTNFQLDQNIVQQPEASATTTVAAIAPTSEHQRTHWQILSGTSCADAHHTLPSHHGRAAVSSDRHVLHQAIRVRAEN